MYEFNFVQHEKSKGKESKAKQRKAKQSKAKQNVLSTANTVETPVSGHPREAEKVSATENVKLVWARVQTGFCEGGR